MITLTYLAFAGVFLSLAKRHRSNFLVYFSVAWELEAVRSSILLMNAIGVELSEAWFLLMDLLYIPVTVFLYLGVSTFTGWKGPKLVIPIYTLTALAGLAANELIYRPHLMNTPGMSPGTVDYSLTLVSLALLLIPGGVIRILLGGLLFRFWKTARMEGAFVAGSFFILHGIGSLKVPANWFFGFTVTGVDLLWFLEIMGLSISAIVIVMNWETREKKESSQALAESERKLTTLIQNLPGMAYRCLNDENHTVTFMSDACFTYTRFSASDFINNKTLKFRDIIHPDDRGNVFAQIREATQKEEPYDLIYRIETSHGKSRWFWERGGPIQSENGTVVALEGFISDITELREAQIAASTANEELSRSVEELELRSKELNLLLELGETLQICENKDEVFRVSSRFGSRLFPDSSGCMFLLNSSESFMEIHGRWNEPVFERTKLAPQSCWAIRKGHAWVNLDQEQGSLCLNLETAEPNQHICVPLIAHSETLGVLHIQAEPDSDLHLRDPETLQTLATACADQVALALASLKLKDLLRAQAIRDPLTGLFNRRFFSDSLDREVARTDRNDSTLGILMLDIDHFKAFNDTFGHNAGDDLLSRLAKLLIKSVRGGDIVCRYGGEEFLIILPDITPSECLKRAQEIRNSIARFRLDQENQKVTISIGMAVYPVCGHEIETVLDAADKALYEAKAKGRNQVIAAPYLQIPQPLSLEKTG